MDMCVHAHMYVHVLVHTCAVYLLCVHTCACVWCACTWVSDHFGSSLLP